MTMAVPETSAELLAKLDVETDIERHDVSAVALLNRSEVEAQIDAAHRHKRSIRKFVTEAMSLATLTREVASSCIYALPRGGKTIPGPSVRLAEIAASAYGNLHVGARVVDVEERDVVAQGVAWDLEKNLRVTVEVRRRITDSKGKRYNDDMITMTGNAAASIALRNAIFRVVPRAYIDTIYEKVREVAVGDAKTLDSRRAAAMAHFAKLGVTAERVLARLGKPSVEDVGLEEYEILVGLSTAIKNGDQTIEQVFPAVSSAPPADVKALEEKLRRDAPKATPVETKPTTTAEPHASKSSPPPATVVDASFDWDAEVQQMKETVREACESKDRKNIDAAKSMLISWAVKAPPAVANEAIRFWNMASGEKMALVQEGDGK